MNNVFQQRVEEAIKSPQHMGEMADADRIGTVGNAECGDLLRVWVKFREENGRKVVDKATFQTFGCETAIAAANLAMELICGKTPEEALQGIGPELTRELGPLPPTKVHCTRLVEDALRSALEQPAAKTADYSPGAPPTSAGNLNESFTKLQQRGVHVVFLPPES